MATIKQLIADGEAALACSDTARLDAEILLAMALNNTRTWLYTWPDRVPSLPEQHMYLDLLRRRKAGEPVAYLVHRREFWGLDLKIDHHVLIPRPETELLVQAALDALAGNAAARVADLGTGSGAIALALASAQPQWQVIATDISSEALELARDNASRLGITNVTFRPGEWLAPLAGMTFDAIVSNPPYIAEGDPHLAEGDVRFEPVHALVSADAGLADIRRIVQDSPAHLAPGGCMILEHGFDQGPAVRNIFTAGGFTQVNTYKDLAGHDRVTEGRSPH
jgi:release factor glutamine methyltransferase